MTQGEMELLYDGIHQEELSRGGRIGEIRLRVVHRFNEEMGKSGWTVKPPEGEMFIWTYRWEGMWRVGLGYWTVTPGQWRDAYQWNTDHHNRATWFHPMPKPPG